MKALPARLNHCTAAAPAAKLLIAVAPEAAPLVVDAILRGVEPHGPAHGPRRSFERPSAAHLPHGQKSAAIFGSAQGYSYAVLKGFWIKLGMDTVRSTIE